MTTSVVEGLLMANVTIVAIVAIVVYRRALPSRAIP
tara:strand:+ start:1113 stop:1220 length:108 start_codon:yes stop_codon:yes gene_type:complete